MVLTRHLYIIYSLDAGLNKAYSILYANFCAKLMQSQLEEHPNFKSKQNYNLTETLEVVKIMMHDPVRSQQHIFSVIESLNRLININQYENENLLDYIKRFK